MTPEPKRVTLKAAPRSSPSLPGFWAQPHLFSPCAGRSFLLLSTETVRTQATDRPTQGEDRERPDRARAPETERPVFELSDE
jgi:hypothetical protein